MRGGDVENRLGCLLDTLAKPGCELLYCISGQLVIDLHPTIGELARIDDAQGDEGVRQRVVGTPLTITGRTGQRAGALRAYLEYAEVVNPSNRTPAGADRGHVDGGHDDREVANVVLGRVARLSIDDGDIGAGAA